MNDKLKSFTAFSIFTLACYWMISFDDKKGHKNVLKGGKGDKLSRKDVDPKEFKMGVKVEMEHTNDKDIARDIVFDHLEEDRHYYSKLIRAGL